MIVRFGANRPPEVIDLARFDRLHAEVASNLAHPDATALARLDGDGRHVWLRVAVLRELVVAGGADVAGFDEMVAYAARKGFASPDASELRAHLEPIAELTAD